MKRFLKSFMVAAVEDALVSYPIASTSRRLESLCENEYPLFQDQLAGVSHLPMGFQVIPH